MERGDGTIVRRIESVSDHVKGKSLEKLHELRDKSL